MHHHHHRTHDDAPSSSNAPHDLQFSTEGIRPTADGASVHSTHENAPLQQGPIVEVGVEPTARTPLLSNQEWDAAPGAETNYPHGLLSRPAGHRSYGSFAGSIHSDNSFGGAYPGITETAEGDAPDAAHALLGDAFADGVMNSSTGSKMSTTRWLAERHGVKSQRMMYVNY